MRFAKSSEPVDCCEILHRVVDFGSSHNEGTLIELERLSRNSY